VSDHAAQIGGWRIGRIAGVAAVAMALAVVAAGVYLWLLWLPEAASYVFTWPESLTLLVAPAALALGLRRAPTGVRIAAFSVCLSASGVFAWVGAVGLFVAGSR